MRAVLMSSPALATTRWRQQRCTCPSLVLNMGIWRFERLLEFIVGLCVFINLFVRWWLLLITKRASRRVPRCLMDMIHGRGGSTSSQSQEQTEGAGHRRKEERN